MDRFRQDGMGLHVQDWASGQQPSATLYQVQQEVGGTGLIDTVAEKAGVSLASAQMAMTALLPMVMSHFTQCANKRPKQEIGWNRFANSFQFGLVAA